MADVGAPIALDDADDVAGGLDVGGSGGNGRSGFGSDDRLFDVVVLGYGCGVVSAGERRRGEDALSESTTSSAAPFHSLSGRSSTTTTSPATERFMLSRPTMRMGLSRL